MEQFSHYAALARLWAFGTEKVRSTFTTMRDLDVCGHVVLLSTSTY